MACRGLPNTYVGKLIIGCPICLIDWLIIYKYKFWRDYGYTFPTTNMFYIPPLIKYSIKE